MSADPIIVVAAALAADPSKLTPESRLGRFPGWDSLTHVKVILALEEAYGIAINDDTIITLTSMAAIIDHVKALTKADA